MKIKEFLDNWEVKYREEASRIRLFQPSLTSEWTEAQKTLFAYVFYHARGHFHDFLWYVGSHADDKETKDIVLKNIAEEFNSSARSHEQLYIDFADSVGADTRNALICDKYHMQFVKDFNHNHLKWLHEHSPDYNFAALAAYEKLDNLDYANLLVLVKSLNVTNKGQIFFKIHSVVEHFAPTYDKLSRIWDESPDAVKKAFAFIGENQLNMWSKLSELIFDENKCAELFNQAS